MHIRARIFEVECSVPGRFESQFYSSWSHFCSIYGLTKLSFIRHWEFLEAVRNQSSSCWMCQYLHWIIHNLHGRDSDSRESREEGALSAGRDRSNPVSIHPRKMKDYLLIHWLQGCCLLTSPSRHSSIISFSSKQACLSISKLTFSAQSYVSHAKSIYACMLSHAKSATMRKSNTGDKSAKSSEHRQRPKLAIAAAARMIRHDLGCRRDVGAISKLEEKEQLTIE